MKKVISSFFYVMVSLFCSQHGIAWAENSPYVKLKSMKLLQMQGIERQALDYSCGAASLSILLSDYFGDEYGEQALLYDMISRLPKNEVDKRISKGFSMLDLKLLLNRLGYQAEGVVLPYTAVPLLDGPVIILLTKGEGLYHFVVLKGVKNGHVFLADPAQGNIRMPMYQLQKEWKGETLIASRYGFGLPQNHDLIVPSRDVASENEIVRTLRNSPVRERKRFR